MSSSRRQSESDTQFHNNSTRRPSVPVLRRLLSNDSTITTSTVISSGYSVSVAPPIQHSVKSLEFLLKVLELVTAVTCAGLYSNALHLMKHSVQSLILPNVVFGSFIIITSVIVLGFVLGHVMPPILVRIFNIVGMTLYFVSGCITILDWYDYARYRNEPEDVKSAHMLLAQACLSFFNVVLYITDLCLSFRKALEV